MRKARKSYSPQEKVAILRRYLLDKVSVLRLCTESQLQPNVFYHWLKQLFDNAPAALKRQPTAGKRPDVRQCGIADLQEQLGPRESREAEQNWMISLTQGQFSSEQVRQAIRDVLSQEEVDKLLTCIRNDPLKYRNRAVAVLSYHRLIRVGHIASFLGVGPSSVNDWVRTFAQRSCQLLLPSTRQYRKSKDTIYRDAVFEILHAPPSAHGINRTTWRLPDIHSVMAKRGLPIASSNIRKIIKEAGYRYRKAKKVLTSNDPNYKDKLMKITSILQNLGPKEKFFSIDEYGPFAIKIQGGGSLVPRGHARTVPQHQRSKGTLIVTAALELSTNQITHFYSPAKNTSEKEGGDCIPLAFLPWGGSTNWILVGHAMPSSEAESRHSRAESSVARRKSGRRTKAVFGAADPSHLWSIFSLAESIHALVLADSRSPPFQGVPVGTIRMGTVGIRFIPNRYSYG